MPKAPRRAPTQSSMTARQRESYEKTLHALSLMRRERTSLTAAAREAGTTPQALQRHARSAIRRVGHRWVARRRDQLERRMLLYDPRGSYSLTVRSSSTASRIGEYHNAVRRFLETGDDSRLQAYRGKFVIDAQGRRHKFLTDPDVIRRLARAGAFRFESIY